MTTPTYAEIAQALADAGYLSNADLDAAAMILADALVVEEAEAIEAAAIEDHVDQEDLIAEAEVWASENAAVGDFESAEIDGEIIADAGEQELDDEDTVIAAEAVIAAAYSDAAAALLAAELIDEANLEVVAGVITEVWTEYDD